MVEITFNLKCRNVDDINVIVDCYDNPVLQTAYILESNDPEFKERYDHESADYMVMMQIYRTKDIPHFCNDCEAYKSTLDIEYIASIIQERFILVATLKNIYNGDILSTVTTLTSMYVLIKQLSNRKYIDSFFDTTINVFNCYCGYPHIGMKHTVSRVDIHVPELLAIMYRFKGQIYISKLYIADTPYNFQLTTTKMVDEILDCFTEEIKQQIENEGINPPYSITCESTQINYTGFYNFMKRFDLSDYEIMEIIVLGDELEESSVDTNVN